METLKLKVSPQGQITIPRPIRQKFAIGEFVYLQAGEKLIIEPVRLEDELEELIAKEVANEGYTGLAAKARITAKKNLMLKALKDELQDRKKGENVSYEDALSELELD